MARSKNLTPPRATDLKHGRASSRWLWAMGRQQMPRTFTLEGEIYEHEKTYKHDFFAATGLYHGPKGHVVLKVGRFADFFGLPLSWLGRLLRDHEARLLKRLASVEGIPAWLGNWQGTGLVRGFVQGQPLVKGQRVSPVFFQQLSDILDKIHSMEMAYVDLEKPENILVADDGSPYLIDFQISWHLSGYLGGRTWPARKLLKILQDADRYHLLKHWRRSYPEQLDEHHISQSYQAPFWISWHRTLFRPITRLRRHLLVRLGARSSAEGRSPG